MSPELPSTWWWVVHEWNFYFRWTVSFLNRDGCRAIRSPPNDMLIIFPPSLSESVQIRSSFGDFFLVKKHRESVSPVFHSSYWHLYEYRRASFSLSVTPSLSHVLVLTKPLWLLASHGQSPPIWESCFLLQGPSLCPSLVFSPCFVFSLRRS